MIGVTGRYGRIHNIFMRSLFILVLIAQPIFPQADRPRPFVTADQLNVSVLLPNPPANNSPEAKVELKELHWIQETRQPAQIAHVRADDAEEDIFIFKSV